MRNRIISEKKKCKQASAKIDAIRCLSPYRSTSSLETIYKALLLPSLGSSRGKGKSPASGANCDIADIFNQLQWPTPNSRR